MGQRIDPCQFKRIRVTIGLILTVAGFLGFTLFGLSELSRTAVERPPQKAAPPPEKTAPPEKVPDVEVNISVSDDIDWPLRTRARNVARQTAIVLADFTDAPTQYGSGFALRPGLVLTAAHVILKDGEGAVADDISIWCDGRETPALPLAYDALRDVGVLMADCGEKTLRLANRPLRHRERAYLLGYDFRDFGRRPTAKIARYVFMTERSPDEKVLARPAADYGNTANFCRERLRRMKEAGIASYEPVAGRPAQGQSGSAVVNAAGRVVGILVWNDPLANRGYYTPATNIRHVLRLAIRQAETAR